MKLIIWLWNPWDKYKNTKHNIWFMFLDYIKNKYNFEDFKYESKFKANISNGLYKWEKSILIKPQTFMNLSWESIIQITNFYKLNIEDWIVIYDDMSMDFWKLRFRDKWSAGWHNWVKDLIRFYKENFKRIKVWIWFNKNFEVSDWVLSKFNEEELIELESNIYNEIDKILEEKI